MARSAEKAMTALARWRAVYIDKVHLTKRRPHLASECDNLKDAMHFRRQIISEISRKVAQIQNPSLGEFKLRDLNDEINKLIREKGYWEDRIKELKGPDYKKFGPKMLDREGKQVPGSRGYRYFGAARELPGVRELFEADPTPPPKKTRGELMRHIDVDYYGYRDEDDGVILEEEEKREKEVILEKVAIWKTRRDIKARKEALPEHLKECDEENIYDVGFNPADEELVRLYDELDKQNEDLPPEVVSSSAPSMSSYIAHVPVPSQEMIEKAILDTKKRELLAKYASDELMEEAQETERLLGIQMEENNQRRRKRKLPGRGGEEQEEEEEEEEDEEMGGGKRAKEATPADGESSNLREEEAKETPSTNGEPTNLREEEAKETASADAEPSNLLEEEAKETAPADGEPTNLREEEAKETPSEEAESEDESSKGEEEEVRTPQAEDSESLQ